MAKKPGRRAEKRAPGWSRETLLREMRAGKPVMDVCAEYSLDTKPTTLYAEVTRWRAQDPEFERQYGEVLEGRGVSRAGGLPPREQLDPSIADWRLKFCEDLFETGKKLEAARRSPFSWEEIVKKLNRSTPSYDHQFAEMVHEVQMKLCAEMEGGFVEAFRESSGRDKAWIAKNWLERQDPARWGKQVELIHSGAVAVNHTHTHRLELPKEERLALLADEQQKFFAESYPAALPEPVIEGEVVSAP